MSVVPVGHDVPSIHFNVSVLNTQKEVYTENTFICFCPVFTHKGMPTETTMAICSMIFGGVFEKFPKLKVCFAHGGTEPWTQMFFKNRLFTLFKKREVLLTYFFYCCTPVKQSCFFPVVTGGSFPFTLGRIKHGHDVRPDLCAVNNKISPDKYLGSFYTDSLVHSPTSLKLLIDVIGKVSFNQL